MARKAGDGAEGVPGLSPKQFKNGTEDRKVTDLISIPRGTALNAHPNISPKVDDY